MTFDQTSLPVYSINAVSEMTGLSTATLRYWEKRFALVIPMRTEGGHRLYSSQDIERIKWVAEKMQNEHLRAREAHALLAYKLQKEGVLSEEIHLRHAIMIMVAEKDPITAELEEHFLKEEGYDVLLVFDGRKAVVEAEGKQPDLIIIDVILPGMSGLRVVEALKANDKTEHIPVLVFSILDVRDRALAAGADAFLLKPINQPEMIDIVKAMLITEMPGAAK